jgi:hypothetical protein
MSRSSTCDSAGRLEPGQRPGDVGDVPHQPDVLQLEHGHHRRGEDDADDERQCSRARPFQQEDHGKGDQRRGQHRQLPVDQVHDRVRQTYHPVAVLADEAGEVGQLAEDDVDRDRVGEPGEDRVRHEPDHGAQPEEACEQHDRPGEQAQGGQRRGGVGLTPHLRNIGDHHRHRTGRLDAHEDRAGGQRAGQRADEIRVEPCERVEPGQQARGQPVGHADQTEHRAGGGVVPVEA